MPTLLGIHGSVTQQGRLHQALELALESASRSAAGRDRPVATGLLHLGDHRISFADGRPLSGYDDDTAAVVRQVTEADMYLIATPIFRGSFTASLKNLLDLTPVEGLMGKACGLVAMGASDHHYLAVDSQLRPVLAWFGAHVAPGSVYLQSRQFQEGKLADQGAMAELESLADSVVAIGQAAAGNPGMTGPLPLAAR